MRNSAYQPWSSVVVATVQLPSQFLLKPPPDPDWKRCRVLKPPPWKRPAAPALVGDLPVVLDAGRGGAEDEAVLVVVVGVQHEHDVVALAHLVVPDALAVGDVVRLAVERPHPHVERIRVEHDPDLGPLAGGLTVTGLALREPGHDRSLLPHGLVEIPVDARALRDLRGGGDRRKGPSRRSVRGPRLRVLGEQRAGCREDQEGQQSVDESARAPRAARHRAGKDTRGRGGTGFHDVPLPGWWRRSSLISQERRAFARERRRLAGARHPCRRRAVTGKPDALHGQPTGSECLPPRSGRPATRRRRP